MIRLGRLVVGARGTRERGLYINEEEDGHVMLPMVGVPETIRKGLRPYRDLVEHSGQLVTKEQVLATVWSGGYVGEGAVTICIAELRKTLGDEIIERLR